jgi:hypothetical protein
VFLTEPQSKVLDERQRKRDEEKQRGRKMPNICVNTVQGRRPKQTWCPDKKLV